MSETCPPAEWPGGFFIFNLFMKKHPTLGLTTKPAPPALRFEDVNWPVIFEQDDFKMMGLCNRHVQIDNTGRDCYGLPLMVDAEAFPLQGSPYCLPFTNWHEKELNKLLWQLHVLREGEYSLTARLSYNWYLQDCEPTEDRPRRDPLTREQYFLQRLVRHIKAKVLPSPRIARYYIVHETPQQYEAREAAAEAKGERYATNLEKFARLDFVGRAIFALEGLVRSQRQELYFAKLLAAAESRQLAERAERRRESNLHFYPIEQQREATRLAHLRARREGQPLPLPEVVQSSLFEAA